MPKFHDNLNGKMAGDSSSSFYKFTSNVPSFGVVTCDDVTFHVLCLVQANNENQFKFFKLNLVHSIKCFPQ